MNFTEEQINVIEHKGSHALVSAVAGSGKTTTLEARIHRLIERGVPPQRILVLAFNRSVREEFQSRFKGFHQSPRIHTFHSLGKSALERYHAKKGQSPWNIDSNDFTKQQLLRESLQTSYPSYSNEDLKSFSDFIEELKAAGRFPSEVKESLEYEEVEQWKKLAYERYEELRIHAKKRFLEDLIYDLLHIIRARPTWISNKYHHVLVDEYQDVNRAQQEVLVAVAGSTAEIMVVGDPDQCIYEWRGSRPDFITRIFAQELPKVKHFSLSNTFRFGHQVSLIANSCIRHNKDRLKTMCISNRNAPATEVNFRLTESEAKTVTNILGELSEKGIKLSEIALLVRAYGHSVGTELMLLNSEIPYLHGKDKPLYEREELQVLSCLLSLLLYEDLSGVSEEYRVQSLRSLLRLSKSFLSKEELDKLSALESHPISEWIEIVETLSLTKSINPKKARKLVLSIKEWCCIGYCNEEITANALRAIARIQMFYDFESVWDDIATRHIDSNDKKRSYQSLLNSIEEMELSAEGLIKLIFKKSNESNEAVTITSIHKAKGMEWPVVLVIGLSEGEFPVCNSDMPDNELEEERRLFYVAVTRAKQYLYLIGPTDPMLDRWQQQGWYGAPTKKEPIASRFLYESDLVKSQLLGQLIDKREERKAILSDKDYLFKNYLKKL